MKEKMFKFNLTFVHEYRDTHKHTHICTVYLLFSQLLETKVIDNHFQSTQAQVEVIKSPNILRLFIQLLAKSDFTGLKCHEKIITAIKIQFYINFHRKSIELAKQSQH